MSRWGKNIVVPLDSLYKEKENTNRPTVARSVGTVGKWGKMGFTSTRTYALSSLPAAVAAAAAAASPAQSPPSLDDDMSPSVPEPPKPKKFFKSRNAAPPEVIAQIIQNLPRTSTSPARDSANTSSLIALSSPVIVREPIKLKIPKSTSAEKKAKSPKKPKAVKPETSIENENSVVITPTKPVEHKSKKKKEEKKLKPEAPPSRVISRARKTVNYCEDDDDDRSSTPLKDVLLPKATNEANEVPEPVLLPPPLPLFASTSGGSAQSTITNAASKTPEHPPIVLRISKGTSRLVSSDSEEQQTNTISSPLQNDAEPVKVASVPSEVTFSAQANGAVTQATPKITVKPPKPPSPESPLLTENDESAEINYCTVKISPDKPPKERLKLIIKTDVIRNAIAAAAAAAAAKAAVGDKLSAADACAADSERPEREKKSKNKKHKHPKHSAVEQLIPAQGSVHSEFKTPSPNLTFGPNIESQQSQLNRIISPTALSERDFDSQSSVLGSISSKGNSTPQLLSQTAPEESCVVRSRGSSVITSDLETSQHSSLVAPPSDIELRLESMMMDNDVSQQKAANVVEEEPLQEDILSVLRGDETEMGSTPLETAKVNGAMESNNLKPDDTEVETPNRRVTRGRTKPATRANNMEKDEVSNHETPQTPRTRNRKHVASSPPTAEEAPASKRITRRGGKKDEEPPMEPLTVKVNQPTTDNPPVVAEKLSPNKSEEENTPVEMPIIPPKRGRSTRNTTNNNNLSNNNNNNNINKIAASLSAKAGAAEVSKVMPSASTASTAVAPRSYGGRKRKNQQVTQVLQPSAEEIEEQQHLSSPKLSNMDQLAQEASTAMTTSANDAAVTANSQNHVQNSNSQTNFDSDPTLVPPNSIPSSPPRRDYQIKDKFKRTLMLENQEEEQQRGSVKLVISKKKGSIFKSRTLVPNDQTEQTAATKRHLYKHRWDAEINGSTTSDGVPPSKANDAQVPATSRTASDGVYDDDFNEESNSVSRSRDNSPSLAKIGRNLKPMPQTVGNTFDMDEDNDSPSEPVPSLRNERRSDYYTRVCNVKTAHQIQEIGEYQEMDDDVEYILDALKPENPTPTRCLSALQLAAKCMTPTFRMHVRAHGVVTKFFKALSDANKDLSLGLCTSAIMFILSQEGLNMDLDRDALELMMNLLESEGVVAPSDQANYERNKQKVREFCEEIKAQGKATHLNVDSITVGTLAMETLLSLTSKRAGEWFKEELRNLGGLEHIIKTISDCSQPLKDSSGINWAQSVFDNIQTVARCMRVLENVTQMNEENQKYMLTYANGSAITNLCTIYVICDRELKINPTTEMNTKRNSVLLELITSLTKVLINLTHTFSAANAMGAEIIGKRTDVIETSLCLLLQSSNYIPDRCIFELSILVLLLLINLTMYTVENRIYIMKAKVRNESRCHEKETEMTAVQAVMEYFYKCEELARLVEKSTDDILDNTNKNKKKQEELDETVNNLLQTAGHHMEHTLKGSYAGILIGHLITDSDEFEAIVRTHLRGNGFQEIISVLEKYYTFMNLTASSEASAVAHIQSMKKLIDYFKKRDYVFDMSKQENDCALPLNLETHHSSADHESSSSVSRSGQRVYKTYSQR